MALKRISDSILYVGADDRTIDLFENQYPVSNGVTYNSYVIKDSKIAVMDTVDERATDQWFDNLEEAFEGKAPDYLVVSHLEPDHSGNIERFLKKYPDTIVVANAKTFAMLPQFIDIDVPEDKRFVAAEGTTLALGKHGYLGNLEVSSTNDLFRSVLEMFNHYDPAKHIHLMQTLGNSYLAEHQFAQILGKMRLYQCLPQGYQKSVPRLLITDTQINSVAKAYIQDENFGGFGSDLSMWRFYNLLTGANKSSYIDSFLDRSLNATEVAQGINMALHGDERYSWFID